MTKTQTPIPPCPRCKTNRHANRHGREEYYCGKCDGIYDNDPDEGGDYGYDPSYRMEKQERRRR